MAGSVFAGPIAADRDPSLAFLARAREATGGTSRNGQRPLEASVLSMQAMAGNAAVGQFIQRQAAGGAGGGGAAPSTEVHSKLQYGARGDEVRTLQGRLNELNAARVPLVIDGIFGRKTQAAVRKYQETHPPLAIDGDAGPETWAALDNGEPGDTATGPETTTQDPYELGKAHYEAGRYGQAYDEFSKAYEDSGDPAHLFNRAQALRLLGGRREETIALYEQLQKETVLPDEARETVGRHLTELRGPGRTTDEKKNVAAALELFEKGRTFYLAEEYGRAYDEFTKAFEASGDPALLWNRAQALRLLGGRRAETITIYEQFITKDVPEDKKKAAIQEIAELKGPVKTGDEKANLSAADQIFKKAKEHYSAEQYAQAYDEFTRAYELTGDPAYLYNRAQALRLQGGRREQAITLFEQFIASNVSEDARKAARAHLEELKGQGKKQAEATAKPPF